MEYKDDITVILKCIFKAKSFTSSSGVLYLTEEEKRTLISEGYPIPTKLPLSKAEERSLKKIRRKIKNKISAQESRRKKKEYMDSLERKYDIMQSEANSWKSKAEALQAQNAALAKQVSELQQKLNMATKTGSEISFILPESIDLEENILQGKNRVSEFQGLTANCLDIDVD